MGWLILFILIVVAFSSMAGTLKSDAQHQQQVSQPREEPLYAPPPVAVQPITFG